MGYVVSTVISISAVALVESTNSGISKLLKYCAICNKYYVMSINIGMKCQM